MSNSIAILGAGESGTGAAVLATKKGHRVFVSDKGLIENKIEFEFDENLVISKYLQEISSAQKVG